MAVEAAGSEASTSIHTPPLSEASQSELASQHGENSPRIATAAACSVTYEEDTPSTSTRWGDMLENSCGSSSSSALGTPSELLVPLDEASMVLLSPTAQKKKAHRRPNKRKGHAAAGADVVAYAGGKDGRYMDGDYGGSHHGGYHMAAGQSNQGHHGHGGTNHHHNNHSSGSNHGSHSRLADRRPKTVVTLQDLGFDLGLGRDAGKVEESRETQNLPAAAASTPGRAAGAAWGAQNCHSGDCYSANQQVMPAECYAAGAGMGSDCYVAQGMPGDMGGYGHAAQHMAADCFVPAAAVAAAHMQGSAGMEWAMAPPPPETPCRGMSGARNLGITSTCPMSPPPTGSMSGAGEAAARGHLGGWIEPLSSPSVSPTRGRAPPPSPVLSTDGFGGFTMQTSPTAATAAAAAAEYNIMSTAPVSSPKRMVSHSASMDAQATLGQSPAGSAAADAVRTWLHSSGLAVGVDLEARLRAMAPETYED